MSNETISQKITKLRKARGMTLEQVADIVGVGKSTVRKWETGMIANMRRDKIADLAKALGTTPAYLMGWEEEGNTHLPTNVRPVTLKKFPMLGKIACGEPIYADQDFETFIEASSEIKADFCLTARGDSMIGAGIHDGDVVFVKEQPIVENGQVAAVIIDDEATLKRWYYYPDKQKLVLNPENPKYEPLVYIGEELEQVRCLGRAVYYMSQIR